MRYERKYRIPGDDFEAIRAIVETHPMSFHKQYPDRQVNNIYMDSPDLECFRDNLVGAMNREKFRIRWYGKVASLIERPVLELKRKDGELGDKFSQEMKQFELGNVRDLEAELKKQFMEMGRGIKTKASHLPEKSHSLEPKDLLPEIHSLKEQMKRAGIPRQNILTSDMLSNKLRLPALRPVLLNSYQRSYYISRDHRYRLTIDRQMKFRSLERHRPFIGMMTHDPAVVIEVKYDFLNDSDYDRVGQFLPYRAGKNSKYVMGMLLVGQV